MTKLWDGEGAPDAMRRAVLDVLALAVVVVDGTGVARDGNVLARQLLGQPNACRPSVRAIATR